jgi:hypothetical protein
MLRYFGPASIDLISIAKGIYLMRYKSLLLCTALLATMASGVHAATVTETYSFSLTGFSDVSGNGVTPPSNLVTGSFTVTFDPTQSYTDDTTDIHVNSLSGVTVDSTLGFSYSSSSQLFSFGGTYGGTGLVYAGTNDLVISYSLANLNDPTFVPCSTPGYTCGNATGSSSVEASGYTTADTESFFFYGAQSTITSAVPEPSTWAMMILGFFGVGFMAYRRKQNGSTLSLT